MCEAVGETLNDSNTLIVNVLTIGVLFANAAIELKIAGVGRCDDTADFDQLLRGRGVGFIEQLFAMGCKARHLCVTPLMKIKHQSKELVNHK